MKFDIKKALPHIIAVITFILISSIYFLPQFQGKVMQQTDITQYKAIASEVIEYNEKGDNILWTNSVFSGMPTYQISAPQKNNVSKYIERFSNVFMARPAGYFIGGMLAFYISLLLLGVNPWIALLGGLTFAFTTNNLVLFEAGHATKVRVLMISVLIIAGLFKTFQKSYLKGGLAFTIGMAVSIYANHYQMTYYLGMILAIFTLIASIDLILKKEFKHLLYTGAILIAGTLIAVGSSASKIWTTYEYSTDTMRGAPILEKTNQVADPNSSSETAGLAWNYAMNWSNGMDDLMTMYIPGVAGGGSSEPIANNSATNVFMKKNRLRPIKKAPLYFGSLPFTSGPQYIGAVSIFLFFLSLFVLDGKTRWWALSAFLLTAVMSMGKNVEWFNQMLFDNLPLLNKFRSPSSITSITAIFVPLIGIMGLNKIMTTEWTEDQKKKLTRNLIITGGFLSAICLYYALLGPGMTDFETPGDARYAQQKGLAEVFQADRASLMRSDAIRTLLLTLAGASVIYFFLKGKMNKYYGVGILAILLLFDLWGVGKRYISYDSFQKARKVEALSAPRAVDKQIDADTDIHFRVHDITPSGAIGPYITASASLHNKTIGGYHAAKLQRYQDVIDGYLMQGNQKVLDMLNMKYLISGQPGAEQVQKNPNAQGNGWFAQDVVRVNTNREEFDQLGKSNLRTTAIIHNDFKNQVSNFKGSTGTVQLTSYHPDKMIYSTTNNSDGLAIFSEVWYGQDKGWKAYIDGIETPIIRANYLLRAINVPSGNHEVIMEFKPTAYYTGEKIGLFCSVLIISGLGFLIYLQFKPTKK